MIYSSFIYLKIYEIFWAPIFSLIDLLQKAWKYSMWILKKISWESKKHNESVMIWKELPQRFLDDSHTNFPIHYTLRL